MGSRRVRRNDTEREPISQKRELLNSEGSAGSGAVERKWVAGDDLGGAFEGVR